MICIPVAAATEAEALEIIRKSVCLADLLELRMDLIFGGKVKELIGAVRASSPSVKVLVTNRADDPACSLREEERIGVLLEAVRLGADFVDVELKTAPLWRERIGSLIGEFHNRTGLIVSVHDFSETPSFEALARLFDECLCAGAQVVKIVTFAQVPEDNLRVLSLIPYARGRNREIIAFCMGEHGKISRVAAPLLGSLFTFASLERGAESASGQLTVHEMKQLFRILEGK